MRARFNFQNYISLKSLELGSHQERGNLTRFLLCVSFAILIRCIAMLFTDGGGGWSIGEQIVSLVCGI